jgi:HEAT repeat protein
MRRKLCLVVPLLLLITLLVAWIVTPREILPDFLRRAGKFDGKSTAYWIETLRTTRDIKERRRAAYALAIISSDFGLDREAKEVLPVLLEGMNDQDEFVKKMSMNAFGPMGRHAVPAVPALIAEAANRESQTREVAIHVLGELGPAAKEAVPVLLEAYREEWGDAYSHYFTGQALKRIDPNAAAAAGVR